MQRQTVAKKPSRTMGELSLEVSSVVMSTTEYIGFHSHVRVCVDVYVFSQWLDACRC